LGKKHKT